MYGSGSFLGTVAEYAFVAKFQNFERQIMKDEEAYLAQVSRRGMSDLQP